MITPLRSMYRVEQGFLHTNPTTIVHFAIVLAVLFLDESVTLQPHALLLLLEVGRL